MLTNAHNIWVFVARFYSGVLNSGMLILIGSMLTLHTGNITRLSMSLIQGNWSEALFPAVAVLSYFVGCVLTSAYYGKFKKGMLREYWKGYLVVAFIFVILWIAPDDGWFFIVVMSICMGIVTSMPLPNRGYTGTITMNTGLITEMADSLSSTIFRQSQAGGEQTLYYFINLISYVLGVFLQMIQYGLEGTVRAWPLIVIASILGFMAYRYGQPAQLKV